MTNTAIWLFACIAAYWAYCLYCGVRAARLGGGEAEFFLGGRALPHFVFVMAGTAASFGGWFFLGHGALVLRDGLGYAELSLAAVAIPLAGAVFLKRQWILGRRYGYVTAGDLFAGYFQSETARLLVLLVALVFAVPFIGLQLAASGDLIASLAGGGVNADVAMWVLAFVVFAYVCLGGMRAVAWVGTLQGLLMAAGLAAIGLIAYGRLGGFGPLNELLAKAGAAAGPHGTTAQGYNTSFIIPGVVQFTAGLGQQAPVGGLWTAAMILSYGFALMGIQAGPLFTTWAFAARSPKSFAPQQVWASAGVMGLLLVLFATAAGLAAPLLGESLPGVAGGRITALIGGYIASLSATAPWFVGLLAVCALAAVQALAAGYAITAGSMLARDVYARRIAPEADAARRVVFGRVAVGLVLLASVALASFAPVSQVQLGALALGFGSQLWPALVAICWVRWFTREAVLMGLIAGLIAVILTEPFGLSLSAFFGLVLPWGRWPWTIHSAGWGIAVNMAVVLIVSAISQTPEARAHRAVFHDYLRDAAAAAPQVRPLRTVAWTLTLGWLFFAIGPGAVIGNDVFGAPGAGMAGWVLGIPSLWAWQILWWGLGVLLLWLLAYKMELSTPPRMRIEPLPASALPRLAATPVNPAVAQRAFWYVAAIAALLAAANWLFG